MTNKKEEHKNNKDGKAAQPCEQQIPDGGQEAQAQPEQERQEDKAQEYYQQLIRLQADFDNYRKRTEKEKPLLIQYGRTEVIKSFLGLYDTLLKAEEEISKEGADIKHIKQGLKMIFEEFNKAFTAQGVCVVCAKGKPYDPMTQEAVTTIPCEDKDDCMVLEEIKKGVTLDGTVIRPAQVIVGKKKEKPEQDKK